MTSVLNPIKLAGRGLLTLLWQQDRPLVGSVILTDRCNLQCYHCAVSNHNSQDYPYEQIQTDMQALFDRGCRILFLYGGEPLLWSDGDHAFLDVVQLARKKGFWLVNAVTNGTLPLDIPGMDLCLVSLDGNREHHNAIRGETYDLVLESIRQAKHVTVILYMAINTINLADIETVAELARSLPNVQAVSYNFHTPYPGTESLTLNRDERLSASRRIARLIDQGYPVLNLKSALPLIARNTAPVPDKHCLVAENGQIWVCGRCRDIPGLCQQCGFFFAAEYSLVFTGRPRVLLDLAKTYSRLLKKVPAC
ncbi:MAG: radical SAM protein [Eubacteriales bacterium]|nr:radical SAM protein [Eubacteriales bacterium]